MHTFGINNHVSNDPNSTRSHYEGSLSDLVFMAGNDWANAIEQFDTDGQPTGVWMYHVRPDSMTGLMTGIVPIGPNSDLRTTVESRGTLDEEAWKKTVAIAKKTQGVSAVLGFYSHETLARKNENSTDCDFELVFFNVEPTKRPSPPSPENMARNYLDLDGGTKMNYTARQFAESIAFWAVHANIASK